MPAIACHPKGTFALQGIVSVLKDFPELQILFLSGVKGHEGRLIRSKDSSYLIKKIFLHFEKQHLADLTAKFMQELQENVTNKYSICIFKEIVAFESADPERFSQLLSSFLKLFPQHKIDTFYHFGLQYLIEVD